MKGKDLNKDQQLVKALIKGTEDKKIKWKKINSISFNVFKEITETIDQAYYFEDNTSLQNIVVYKASSIVPDGYGEEVNKTNVHLFFCTGLSFEVDFKISDYELGNSSLLWTLYKLAQRSESGADLLIDSLIKKYGSDDLPF